jgi:CheY-like chemotaxis protein
MYVLIVEDDWAQYEFISQALLNLKPVPRVVRFGNEKEFNDRFEELAADRPDVILMDIMLRWANPAPQMEQPPEEVKRDGFYRAGLRCERMLAGDERTKEIPVIIHSVLSLEPEDLPKRAGVKFLPKNFDIKELARELRNVRR